MKLFVTLLCLTVAVATEVQVLRNDAEVNPESFKYAYELDNSIKADQQGELQGDFNWVVNGKYSYISPEGQEIELAYTADENGYHPDTSNPLLPTSPPIPDAIQRSLQYLAAHPPPVLQSTE